jgi:hypothetical protein
MSKISDYQKQWRENNKEKIKAYRKKYYEANKEKIIQDTKKYRQENKDKVLEYETKRNKDPKRQDFQKKNRIKNKDKILERDRKRYKNPERMKSKSEFSRKYAKENASKIIAKKYKLTEEEINEFYIKQKNLCGICGNKEKCTHKGKLVRLSIDHCHTTGKVRGLLCRKCNLAIGNFNDSKELLQKALLWIIK